MNITTEKEVKKSLPQLIKMSDTYKLIVPAKVEEKIRYLCRKFPTLEWSGVLFTSHSGSFEGKDLVIICQDFYPMDLGSSTYTDFNMSPDVAGYIADNIELFNYDLNLCHSHNQMSCFFSSTDLSTLRAEGADKNCFVSLIVNNRGEYCAAITRKVKQKIKVTTQFEDFSYEFFGEGSIRMTNPSEESKFIDEEVIQYFMLDVEREEVKNPLSYLDARFDEIEKKKQEEKKKTIIPSYSTSPCSKPIKEDEDFYDWIHQSTNKNEKKPDDKVKEATIWDAETMKEMEVPFAYIPDEKLVHEAVVKMLLLSLNFKTEGFDLKQWIIRHMDNVYNNTFSESSFYYDSFEVWVTFIVEFILNAFPELPNAYVEGDMDEGEYYSCIAQAMFNELSQYSSLSKHIKSYMTELQKYI